MQQKPVACLKGGEWNQRVLVVYKTDVRSITDQLGRIQSNRFVQLQRVARSPKIAVCEEQLIERRVYFDSGLQIQEIQTAVRQTRCIDLEWPIRNAFEIQILLFRQLDSFSFHLAIETDEKVVDVQIVFEKNVIDEVCKVSRPQGIKRNFDAGYIRRHKPEDFRAYVEVAQN